MHRKQEIRRIRKHVTTPSVGTPKASHGIHNRVPCALASRVRPTHLEQSDRRRQNTPTSDSNERTATRGAVRLKGVDKRLNMAQCWNSSKAGIYNASKFRETVGVPFFLPSLLVGGGVVPAVFSFSFGVGVLIHWSAEAAGRISLVEPSTESSF